MKTNFIFTLLFCGLINTYGIDSYDTYQIRRVLLYGDSTAFDTTLLEMEFIKIPNKGFKFYESSFIGDTLFCSFTGTKQFSILMDSFPDIESYKWIYNGTGYFFGDSITFIYYMGGSFGSFISVCNGAKLNTANLNDIPKQNICISPNPATTTLTLIGIQGITATYTIYNLSGTLQQQGQIRDGTVHVSALPKGVYILNLENGGEMGRYKFLKE